MESEVTSWGKGKKKFTPWGPAFKSQVCVQHVSHTQLPSIPSMWSFLSGDTEGTEDTWKGYTFNCLLYYLPLLTPSILQHKCIQWNYKTRWYLILWTHPFQRNFSNKCLKPVMNESMTCRTFYRVIICYSHKSNYPICTRGSMSTRNKNYCPGLGNCSGA